MQADPLDRVFELLADGEAAGAHQQLDELVRAEPGEGGARALRALVRRELGRTEEAADDIRIALELSPENPFVQFAAGAVALEQGEPLEAIGHAREARALAPGYVEAALLEARARVSLGQWNDVLPLTSAVLDLDPDHEEAAVLERLALDSRREGMLDPVAWTALARRFPLNPLVRTASGWTSLTAGRVRDARREFEQALALDPSESWAREGLVLALKARNPVYALLLRFFLWFQKLPRRTRVIAIIGGVVGYRLLRTVSEAQPGLRPVLVPLMVGYVLFVLLTWLADPLLNLLLMARGDTRRFLPEDERQGALLVGGCLGLAALFAVLAALTGASGPALSAFGVGFTSLAVAAAYQRTGHRRRRLQWIAAGAFALSLVAGLAPPSLAGTSLLVAVLGVIAALWMTTLGHDDPRSAR